VCAIVSYENLTKSRHSREKLFRTREGFRSKLCRAIHSRERTQNASSSRYMISIAD